jgi:hypothetical protein
MMAAVCCLQLRLLVLRRTVGLVGTADRTGTVDTADRAGTVGTVDTVGTV